MVTKIYEPPQNSGRRGKKCCRYCDIVPRICALLCSISGVFCAVKI